LDIVATWYAQNHRVLIFSQTIQTLNILEFHFSRLHYRYERVDGKTSLTQRHAILEKFNEDPVHF
jgi:SNF2 family DNA or RNA helicase